MGCEIFTKVVNGVRVSGFHCTHNNSNDPHADYLARLGDDESEQEWQVDECPRCEAEYYVGELENLADHCPECGEALS